jgi:DNA primase
VIPLDQRERLTAKAEEHASHLEHAVSYLLTRGISRDAAEMFGLGCVKRGQEYGGRLAIPYYTPRGGVVAIKYRAMDESAPKYLNEEGTRPHLYNASALVKADRAVVTEGELDAITVQAYTGIPAVAYPGTQNWREHFRLCFEGIAEVIVVADEGDPGRESAKRVSELIGQRARVVRIPDGLDDANSFITRQGAEAFVELIR